jgi:uncharacterized protein involved in exopolysaccharide biosynthesis
MAYEIALPQEESRTLEDYLDALKRRRKPALLLAGSLLVLGVLVIFLLPKSYRSTATILIEEAEVPPGLVPSTVTTFASRQVQYINQRVMTRTNLAQIIEKFNLYPEERKYLPTLMLVPDVEKDVKIDVIDVQTPSREGSQSTTTTIAFQLSFQHKNPATAREVANELVSLYLGENVRVRTEQTAQTSQFMNAEVERLDKEMKDIGAEISEFKNKNEGALPELTMVNQQIVQRLDDELLDVGRQLRANHGAKILLEAQLATVQPTQPRLLADGKPIISPYDQLKSNQTQLTVAESRYGPDHPDVLRLKRNIEGLKAQLGDVDATDTKAELNRVQTELAKSRERYGPEHPQVIQLQKEVDTLKARADAPRPRLPAGLDPDNPAYIQIQSQLKTLEAEDAALSGKTQDLRRRIAETEGKIGRTAEVERGLMDMARRLETATRSYQEARAKLFSAKMGEALETQSKGERFSLVEPPDLPLLPASPNRPLLLALLVFLALAAGFGWPQAAESFDHSINGARAVERIQGSPPIAEIPFIETERDQQTKKRKNIVGWLAVPAALLVVALLINFLWIPLDVLWYVGLRRLGL